MRNDFGILILTHGRAREMKTLHALERAGYTGRWYLVIDDEDNQADEYRALYGDHVVQFCKRDTALWTDAGDNHDNRKAILWARNESFRIAKDLGLTYFMMNDDDFCSYNYWMTNATHDIKHTSPLHTLDDCIEMAIGFLDATKALSVAFAQGGDYIGGANSTPANKLTLRKCMNTFICRSDRPFQFYGRMNEDVTTYVRNAMLGKLMFTITPFFVIPPATQSISGGMSEEYKKAGTYTKTFYSVMYAPSAVKISVVGGGNGGGIGKNVAYYRVHHHIDWKYCCAKIINEKYKKK